jgi:hypothetical protein
MLAIGKAVNFALAICHPFVLCHLQLGPFGIGVFRSDPWLVAKVCQGIIEAYGRPEGAGREIGSLRVLRRPEMGWLLTSTRAKT